MLLRAAEILAGYPFVARRFGVTLAANETAVRAALDAARLLCADTPALEPAAVFYVFATYRRAFPGMWRPMAQLLARSQARVHGLQIDAEDAAFDLLCSEVMHKRAGFDAVRVWFSERLHVM